MPLPERAAQIRAVLGVARDRPAVDATDGAENPVSGNRPGAKPWLDNARAQRLEAAGVAERLEPLEGIEAPDLLTFNRRAHDCAPINTSVTLWPPNANEFEIAAGGWPLESTSGRASPGT